MPLIVRKEPRDGYVAVRLEGDPSLDDMIELVQGISTESRDWKHGRLLVDLRGVRSLRTFTEQFTLGEQAAQNLRHLKRVASVVPAERVTRNSERPARKAGLDLVVFTDEAQAVQWLLEPPAG